MSMAWFGYLFLLLGTALLLGVPLILASLRRDPMSMIRPQWHDVASPGCAYVLGGVIIVISLVVGVTALYVGVRLLM